MKFRTNIFGMAFFVALLAAGSVFAQDVKVDSDQTYDFSKVKTFAVKIGTSWGNPLSEKRAIAEIQGALTKKGWTVADEATADAIVILHGASEQQKSLNTFYSGGGYRWGGFGGMGSATTTVTEYTVGTLVVDMFDAKSKDLIFRGIAQAEVSNKPEKNQKKLQKATEKMFKNFPPAAAKK